MNGLVRQHVTEIVKQVVKQVVQTQSLNKRTPLVVANWKMNMSLKETIDYVQQLEIDPPIETIICPPYPLLYPVNVAIEQYSSQIKLGAQNVHYKENGAYTGEVSTSMLQEVGCQYAIVGHSERRAMGETDEDVHEKVKQLLASDMSPIICVGEDSEAYNQGRTKEVVQKQVRVAVNNLSDLPNIVIAYEPIWAIGTGKSATPDNAEAVHQTIRRTLYDMYGEVSEKIPILYGGSVKPDNAANLAAKENIDGVLVGGASLNAGNIQSIIHSFNKEKNII